MANIKYTDQKYGEGTPLAGEYISVNGYYKGNHEGVPMQDAKAEVGVNKDAYYVEHNTIHFGTIMQDGASNANNPEVMQ